MSVYSRRCWFPITEHGDGDVYCSKFSGIPYLKKDEVWPVCDVCNNQMQLFFQLNFDSLPEELKVQFGSGLLQFFCCTNFSNNDACGKYDIEYQNNILIPPYEKAKTKCVRIIRDTSYPVKNVPFSKPKVEFEPKRIIGWESKEDTPDFSELLLLDKNYQKAGFENKNALFGDKLLGWPAWIQGVRYPGCPICNRKMRHLFQIDSEDNLNYMWGDAGVGYISQCETHRDEVIFRWDCG